MAPGARARLLRSFASIVDDHIEELAGLEVENSGHTIGNARWEAGNVRDVLNYYSAAPERLVGKQIPVPGGVDLTFHEPLGVVGVILPGVPGTPFLIAGIAVLAPGGPQLLMRWAARRPKGVVHKSLKQMGRWLDDLERRYPRLRW